jgi:hypothetical protein
MHADETIALARRSQIRRNRPRGFVGWRRKLPLGLVECGSSCKKETVPEAVRTLRYAILRISEVNAQVEETRVGHSLVETTAYLEKNRQG